MVGLPVRVGVVQETLDARQDGGNVVGGRPAVLQDVQTELAVGVNVRVEHLRAVAVESMSARVSVRQPRSSLASPPRRLVTQTGKVLGAPQSIGTAARLT